MKPVAYAMFRDGEYYDAIHPDEYVKTAGEYDIPLYTHPAKTLTDEEISEIIQHLENAKYVGASKAATMLRQQQAEIKDLKQQVAFLEDWRDTWSPTIKQLMNINVKVNEK
jgi:hypothetical protein